jgi:thiosulfate/3-mercaptopyruvate sulfurtransferase
VTGITVASVTNDLFNTIFFDKRYHGCWFVASRDWAWRIEMAIRSPLLLPVSGRKSVNRAWRGLHVLVLGLTCRRGLAQDSLKKSQFLDTGEVKALLDDPAWMIVDVRDSSAFNGWPLPGEKRGGHLPGGVNIALSWVAEKLSGVEERLKASGILGGKKVVMYGTNSTEAEKMADLLVRKFGVDPARLYVYRAGLAAWSADESLPMDRLPGFERLVPATWLFDECNARPELRVYHVSWGEGKDYAEGHVPGAVHLNTDLLEEPPLWKVVPAAQLTKALTSLGISRDTPVVLYAADNMAAARVAVVLHYAGVEDVRLLDGGFPAWKQAGLPIQTGRIQPTPVNDFGASIPCHPEVFVGMDTARELLADSNKVLVDVRSWQEHVGKVSGYPDIEARGRIPGAVWGGGGSDARHMEDYRNPDNTLRDCGEIARFWAQRGITPAKQLVGFHCGTGWRVCEAYLAAWVMGWKNITIYDSGWYEWSADPSNPIAMGDPSLAQTEPQRTDVVPEPLFTKLLVAVVAFPMVLLVVLVTGWDVVRRRAKAGQRNRCGERPGHAALPADSTTVIRSPWDKPSRGSA